MITRRIRELLPRCLYDARGPLDAGQDPCAAIIAIGPVTVAASMFPTAARRASADLADTAATTTLQVLHRICCVYAGIGISVPLFGFAVASCMGVLGSGWLIVSITLTAAAAGILVTFVLPRQDELLEHITGKHAINRSHTAQLAMFTGVFNLLWATVTIPVIVRKFARMARVIASDGGCVVYRCVPASTREPRRSLHAARAVRRTSPPHR